MRMELRPRAPSAPAGAPLLKGCDGSFLTHLKSNMAAADDFQCVRFTILAVGELNTFSVPHFHNVKSYDKTNTLVSKHMWQVSWLPSLAGRLLTFPTDKVCDYSRLGD